MPTGSLCAERNAIGSCLATDPSIHRRDMTAMAVLSMVLPEENPLASLSTTQSASEKDSSSSLTSTLSSNSDIDAFMDSRSQLRRTRMQVLVNEEPVPAQQRAQNPINPCGACREWLKKIAICNPDFRVRPSPSWVHLYRCFDILSFVAGAHLPQHAVRRSLCETRPAVAQASASQASASHPSSDAASAQSSEAGNICRFLPQSRHFHLPTYLVFFSIMTGPFTNIVKMRSMRDYYKKFWGVAIQWAGPVC